MKDKFDKAAMLLLYILCICGCIALLVDQYKKTTVTLEQTTIVEDKFVEVQKDSSYYKFICESDTYTINQYLIDKDTIDKLKKNDGLTFSLYGNNGIVQISKNNELLYSYETYNLKAKKQFNISVIILPIFFIVVNGVLLVIYFVVARKKKYIKDEEIEELVGQDFDLNSINQEEYDKLISSIKRNDNIYEGSFFDIMSDEENIPTLIKVLLDYFNEDEINLLIDPNEKGMALLLFILNDKVTLDIVFEENGIYEVSKELIWYYPRCKVLSEERTKYLSELKLYALDNPNIKIVGNKKRKS